MILWMSRKQRSIALRTTEAEYIPTNEAFTKDVWLRKLFVGLFVQELESMVIHCNNKNCANISENPMFHDRLKHIEVKYYYNHDMVHKRAIGSITYPSMSRQLIF